MTQLKLIKGFTGKSEEKQCIFKVPIVLECQFLSNYYFSSSDIFNTLSVLSYTIYLQPLRTTLVQNSEKETFVSDQSWDMNDYQIYCLVH